MELNLIKEDEKKRTTFSEEKISEEGNFPAENRLDFEFELPNEVKNSVSKSM